MVGMPPNVNVRSFLFQIKVNVASLLVIPRKTIMYSCTLERIDPLCEWRLEIFSQSIKQSINRLNYLTV